MAANSTERHGQEMGWSVTSPHIERPNEMGGPAVTKETVKPIATHPTQHRILLTSRQRQSSNRTRQEEKETPGVVNVAKVVMSNMEVLDGKGQMLAVQWVTFTLSQAEASEVQHQAYQAQVCAEKYTQLCGSA